MEQITLDMIPNSHTPTAHISQYDSGRHIRFNLQNITLTGSETVTLKIRKTDGELVSKTIENHTSYVEYVSEKADCDVSGKANCEIVISKDDVVIGSKNFILNIEADPYDDAGVVTETASGAIATFETNIVDVLQEVKCEINATGGNGTPDNPNPINGYTKANITRSGVNFLDKTSGLLQGKFIDTYQMMIRNIGQTGASIYCPIKGGLTYTVSKTSSARFTIGTTTDLPELNTDINAYQTNNSATSLSITTTENDNYLVIFFFLDSADTKTQQEILDTIQVEVGSQTTTYHSYMGDTATIDFGKMVYGGVLDVTSGKLHVTYGSKLLDDNITWVLSAQGYWYTTALSNVVKKPLNNATKANALAEQYSIDTFNNVHATTPNTIGVQSNGTIAVYNGDSVNTPQGLFIYELATPIDIDLTPQQIEALLGVNNVWHDGNGNTEVKYLYNA